MQDSNGNSGDGPLYPIKPLPGTTVSGPKWLLFPPDIYVVEPKEWLPKGPIGWLISTVVLPAKFAGIDITMFCNIGRDKESGKYTLGYGHKLSKAARRLFPDDVKYCDPPLGRLLEHYLIAEVVTADTTRVGGKVMPKPLDRQYSKGKTFLAAGPRLTDGPPSDQALEQMNNLLTEWRTKNSEQ